MNKKKAGLQLPAREYYRLDQAAAYLRKRGASDDVDADYLLHLGANKRLLLCVLAAEWPMYDCSRGDDYDDDWRDMNLLSDIVDADDCDIVDGLLYFDADALLRIEAEGKNNVQFFYRESPEGSGNLKMYRLIDRCMAWSKAFGLVVTDDHLFVRRECLDKLLSGGKETKELPIVAPNNVHGNALLNSIKRSEVLAALLAVKVNSPLLCINSQSWADFLEQKSPVFWSKSGVFKSDKLEAPLKPSSVVSLLRQTVKIATDSFDDQREKLVARMSQRERALRALIAVKVAYPDECIDVEKWAGCYREKARLFWVYRHDFVLSQCEAVDLLNEVTSYLM